MYISVHEREACGLGFDDSTSTLKMVCVVLRNQLIMRSPYHDHIDVVKEDLCTMVPVLGTEEFGLINPPHTHVNWCREHLVGLDDQVGLVYYDVRLKYGIEVWLLKQTKWVIHCRLDQKPPLPTDFIKVLGYWNKDGDLLITNSLRKRLFVYSLKDGVLHEAHLIYSKKACQTDIRMYQGTFFSILHSINR